MRGKGINESEAGSRCVHFENNDLDGEDRLACLVSGIGVQGELHNVPMTRCRRCKGKDLEMRCEKMHVASKKRYVGNDTQIHLCSL